jgi:hypothetical protein
MHLSAAYGLPTTFAAAEQNDRYRDEADSAEGSQSMPVRVDLNVGDLRGLLRKSAELARLHPMQRDKPGWQPI